MDNRTEQIRNLLSQHRQQKESGALTDEELVQNNPERMPELLQELKKLKLIEQAREAAAGGRGREHARRPRRARRDAKRIARAVAER